jgi:hypothetical protein
LARHAVASGTPYKCIHGHSGAIQYVLGCDAKGKPLAEADEIPVACGVMVSADGKLNVIRTAPKRPANGLPFAVWMALAKAVPVAMKGLTESELGLTKADL